MAKKKTIRISNTAYRVLKKVMFQYLRGNIKDLNDIEFNAFMEIQGVISDIDRGTNNQRRPTKPLKTQ